MGYDTSNLEILNLVINHNKIINLFFFTRFSLKVVRAAAVD